jgi:hypothetical protein
LDADGHLGSLYSVSSIPTTFLIGPDGKLWAQAVGMVDWASPSLLKGFQAILKE